MSDRVVERVRRALKVWGCCPAESRPVAPCVATALALTFFVVGILVLNDDYRGPDDDLGISMVLSGLYPDGGQCLFTSAVLNGIIYQLNIAIPELNWFLVIERLAVTVAFFSFCAMLRSGFRSLASVLLRTSLCRSAPWGAILPWSRRCALRQASSAAAPVLCGGLLPPVWRALYW